MMFPDKKVEVGKRNKLQVVTITDFGVYLNAFDLGEILLPRKDVPQGTTRGDYLDVFIYLDSDDRLIATTAAPFAMAGEFAYLKVVSVTPIGAFLDWGLVKDLLVPFGQQKQKMIEGRYYLVYVYFDKATHHMVASTKVHKFMGIKRFTLAVGEHVDLIICNRVKLGYNVVINKKYIGLLHKNDILQAPEEGRSMKGYIKSIRSDRKIDVALQKPGGFKKEDLVSQILAQIETEGGCLSITDKSPPEEIYTLFKVSKKIYKRALGDLYKQRIISITPKGIMLAKK